MPLVKEKLGRVPGQTHVDLLIYGFTGAGKTYRAATAPGPLYIATADISGHKAIPFEIDGVVAHEIATLQKVVEEFYAGGHGYKTLIIDMLSMFHSLWVRDMGEMFHKKRGAADPDLMPIQGRMKILNQYRTLLRDAIDLTQHDNPKDRVHVIFTTSEERIKEDEAAPFSIRPIFGTKTMNEEYPAMFGTIAYIQPVDDPKGDGKTYEGTRKMLVSPQYGVIARDKVGIFEPEYDEAPNLAEVFEKLAAPTKTTKKGEQS